MKNVVLSAAHHGSTHLAPERRLAQMLMIVRVPPVASWILGLALTAALGSQHSPSTLPNPAHGVAAAQKKLITVCAQQGYHFSRSRQDGVLPGEVAACRVVVVAKF